MFDVSQFLTAPLSFEQDLIKIGDQIQDLKASCKDDAGILKTITSLEEDLIAKISRLYDGLTPIQKVEIARHPLRPHGTDYINHLCGDFFEICGDRCLGDDRAIIAGIANFRGVGVVFIAQEKGHDNESRKIHNFGMPMPEGYRKAARAMQIAEELAMPVVCLIDTPGAYPGVVSEEHGQGYVLAECLSQAAKTRAPIISCLIGEGGSGGAVAIGVANWLIMLEHSVYSVISPEGCASILWKAKDKKSDAAAAQKLTAQDLLKYALIDEIVKEPFGGAHRDKIACMNSVGDAIHIALQKYPNKAMYGAYAQQRAQKYA